MLGLPKSTECSTPLNKTTVYSKFNMDKAEKEKFDADISRMAVVAEISPASTSIAPGEKVSSIFVLRVLLKHKEYDVKIVSSLFKLIDQKIVLLLVFEEEQRLAVYHTKLFQSAWEHPDALRLELKGLSLDSVWENIVMSVGGIRVADGNTLEEQIVIDERNSKLAKEIERLEKMARRESQPKKKFDLAQKIKNMQKELGK